MRMLKWHNAIYSSQQECSPECGQQTGCAVNTLRWATQDKRTSRREPFEIEDGQMQSPTLGTDIVPALLTVH